MAAMRYLALGLSIAAMLPSAPATAQEAEQRIAWNRPAEPFRLIDNVHYVGTHGLSAFLITDPKGHVLIDGGLPESAPLIADNIRKLGFEPKDIRYILVNHAHYDHSGGLAALKTETGAMLLASAGDRPSLESGRTEGRPELDGFPAVSVDREIGDGETIELGGIRLTTMVTPGHTPGCTSWLLHGPNRSVLFACSLTVAGQDLIDDPSYPQAAADFRRTFAKLRATEADVFLNFHPDFFNLDQKRARQIAGDQTAFVDAAELERQVERAERMFEEELARQKQDSARSQ